MMGSPLGFGVLLVTMVGVLLVFPPAVRSAKGRGRFLHQAKGECFFSNGTAGQQEVSYLKRYIYGRQEFVRFDSRVGRYEAVTELGEPDAEYWNSQPEVLERRRAQVDIFCRHNYGVVIPFGHRRRVRPQVEITPTDYDPASHNTLLICSVAGFYPEEVEITWLRNGEEESQVVTTALIRNGDWTYQIHVMLETRPERGDVYGCRVEHASLSGPVTVQWEPYSDSARSKMWTGVVGIVLGLVFLVPGFVLFLKNKKGSAVPQPAAAGLMG